MTTTSQYQKKPDFFSSPQECLAESRRKENTNPRYKFFNQTHFTAGDVDQFEQYRDPTNGNSSYSPLGAPTLPPSNIYSDIPIPIPEKYHNICASDVDNTFKYIFYKFKKGIFLKIKNGKLDVFLPFSNKNFVNEWHKNIKIDPKYGDLTDFLKYVANLGGYKFFPNSVNRSIETWYSNNCLVRTEFPIHEGDTNNPICSDMFKVLAETRTLPDVEFFLNRRDFPIIKADLTEPYHNMFGTDKLPLLSHSYPKYAPILSMVSGDNYADIPIPTGDDWARICERENKYFADTCNRSFKINTPPWEKRKPIAIFRGSSTGCGTTIETNPRLKLAFMASKKPVDTDGLPLLDAGITSWNLRPRKLADSPYLQTIDIKSLPFSLVKKMSPVEQAEYKYTINVDGHVSAFRLSLELESGMCVLLVDSPYKIWYKTLLKPYEHYIPVKRDLSDLLSQIKWCKENDEKCRKISKNAKKFALKYLSKDGILDYLQKLLYDIKNTTGTYMYNSKSLTVIRNEEEQKYVSSSSSGNSYPSTNKTISDISVLPKGGRNYSLLRGLEWIFSMFKKGEIEKVCKKVKDVFKNDNTVVTEWEGFGYKFVQKSTKNDITHETFVAKKCTNELLKKIPNFGYVFSSYSEKEQNNIIMEKVQGISMYDYLHGKEFSMADYLSILIQLSLALQVAQKLYGFVHNDLAPWNIIIQKLPKPITFDYPISYKKVYRVKTTIIPVIIDMGRSHVIYENKHYGEINMFSTSTVQDILHLLSTTIYEIVSENLIKKDAELILKLSNFLTGNKYREKSFTHLGDLKYFLNQTKKYSSIMFSEKHELEQKTPLDLVSYILEKFPSEVAGLITETDRVDYSMMKGNPRQVFDYILSKNIEEKINSFLDVFKRARECTINSTNKILGYYTLSTISDSIISVRDKLLEFCKENKIVPDKYLKEYEKTVSYLDEYKEKIDNLDYSSFSYTIPVDIKLSYSESLFSNPKKLKERLEETKEETKNYTPVSLVMYKDILEGMYLNKKSLYVLGDGDYKGLEKLLKMDSVVVGKSIANVVSLYFYAGKIAENNLVEIESNPELTGLKNIFEKIKKLSYIEK